MEQQESTENQPKIKNVSFLMGAAMESVVDNMASDMRFFAIFYIIYGGLMTLTIIGAIIGIPLIIYNLKLKDSAEKYREFTLEKDFYKLNKAFENQRKFFFFHKVILIILIVFMVLYIAFFVIFGLSMFMSGSPDSVLAFLY